MMSNYCSIIRWTTEEKTQPAHPGIYPAGAERPLLVIGLKGQEKKRGRTTPYMLMRKALIQQQGPPGILIPANARMPD